MRVAPRSESEIHIHMFTPTAGVKKKKTKINTRSLTAKCENNKKKIHLILQEEQGGEERGRRRWRDARRDWGLYSALMTFGKQRAPSVLEET